MSNIKTLISEIRKKEELMTIVETLLKKKGVSYWSKKCNEFPWINNDSKYNFYCYTTIAPIINSEDERVKNITAVFIDNCGANGYGVYCLFGNKNMYPMKLDKLPINDVEKIVNNLF